VLNKLLREKFVAHGRFMVAPSGVALDPDYDGPRAGMQVVNGSWKFAYFVMSASEADQP
jgi:hypothetical protein